MPEHRPTKGEEGVGRMAAQIVIQHLRTFMANARVLVLAETGYGLDRAMNGPNGLLTLYGDEFPGARHKAQMNHKYGGQVQLVYALTGGGASETIVQAGVYTLIWCERAEKPSERLSQLLFMAQKRMRTGQTVLSSDGIAQI
jgi:hypothetical protein